MKAPVQWLIRLFLLAVIVVLGYLLYRQSSEAGSSTVAAPTGGLLKTEAEFRDKLVELRMQRDKVERGIRRLEGLKAKTLQELRDKGIESGKDFQESQDPEVKYLVTNLNQWRQQIAKIKQEVVYYDDAINGIRVMLDKIERQRISDEVSLTEDESFELQKIIVDLNERLQVEPNVLEREELEKMLDLEMSQSSDTEPLADDSADRSGGGG